MNKKTFYSIGAIVIAVLIAVVCYWFFTKEPAHDSTTNTSPTGNGSVVTPGEPSTDTVYENDYMRVSVPKGWAIDDAGNAPKANAINITKGNYILYINPNASQASGVDGGRFAEIAMGAPSADAVVVEQPSPPCGTEKTSAVKVGWTRHDWFVSSADKKDYCAVPSGSGAVWYFSYITDSKNGYINYYTAGNPPGWVITMGYNSKTVNALPTQNSSELSNALAEMTDIAKTLELKQQIKK